MADDWSREEVEAAVTDYFSMLALEVAGQTYNKAEHNRNLQKLLNERNRGSVEWKHRNISAVLNLLGYPALPGYKPAYNYQTLLREVVEDRVDKAFSLQKIVEAKVQQPAEEPVIDDILSTQVEPPERDDKSPLLNDKPRSKPRFSKKNYLELEARNRSLGVAGEQFVLRYERAKLIQAGKNNLADKIEHIAATKGDGAGFDILSFEPTGQEIFIEVKTTRFGSLTPFFTSTNEVEVSDLFSEEYRLYRLFAFEKQPKFFILPGFLGNSCDLKAVLFSALPKNSKDQTN